MIINLNRSFQIQQNNSSGFSNRNQEEPLQGRQAFNPLSEYWCRKTLTSKAIFHFPLVYLMGMVGYALALVFRIAVFAKEFFRLFICLFRDLFIKWELGTAFKNLQISLIRVFGATVELISGVIGLVLPVIAYLIDDGIQRLETVHASSTFRGLYLEEIVIENDEINHGLPLDSRIVAFLQDYIPGESSDRVNGIYERLHSRHPHVSEFDDAILKSLKELKSYYSIEYIACDVSMTNFNFANVILDKLSEEHLKDTSLNKTFFKRVAFMYADAFRNQGSKPRGYKNENSEQRFGKELNEIKDCLNKFFNNNSNIPSKDLLNLLKLKMLSFFMEEDETYDFDPMSKKSCPHYLSRKELENQYRSFYMQLFPNGIDSEIDPEKICKNCLDIAVKFIQSSTGLQSRVMHIEWEFWKKAKNERADNLL
ncbi:MAG: hypothetical protein R3E91_05190 [Chlamydiales bacterium]